MNEKRDGGWETRSERRMQDEKESEPSSTRRTPTPSRRQQILTQSRVNTLKMNKVSLSQKKYSIGITSYNKKMTP